MLTMAMGDVVTMLAFKAIKVEGKKTTQASFSVYRRCHHAISMGIVRRFNVDCAVPGTNLFVTVLSTICCGTFMKLRRRMPSRVFMSRRIMSLVSMSENLACDSHLFVSALWSILVDVVTGNQTQTVFASAVPVSIFAFVCVCVCARAMCFDTNWTTLFQRCRIVFCSWSVCLFR